MFKKQNLNAGLACLFLFSAIGCASTKNLETYPRGEIDRPFTLPEGMGNWQTAVGVESTSSSSVPTDTQVTGNMIWEESLSEDWTLLWAPLPLGVLHQFVKNDIRRLGAGFSLGFSGSSVNGFAIFPKFEFSDRHYFSESFALDLVPFYTPRIAFQSGQGFHWVAGLKIAPLFQVSETLALQPSVSLSAAHGDTQPVGSDNFNSTSILPGSSTRFTVPIAGSIKWSVSRRWDLDFQYTYFGIGYQDGFTDQFASVNAVYFW